MRRRLLVLSLLTCLSWAAQADTFWQALKQPGHVALLRHALAPGTGDPADFELGNCATQRNLNDKGRKQAREIGASFRQHGIVEARVFSSQWCRCLETARLMALGAVNPQAELNSFFRAFHKKQPQTEATTRWLTQLLAREAEHPVTILVTHQVNITALTGIFPASGEMLVAKVAEDGTLTVVARKVF